ncbi:MAG: DUF2269 family protein [Bacteroidota bacterium]
MEYTFYKLLHIVGVILFLGNISIGLFWLRIAVKSADPKILAHSLKGIIAADMIFTIPGVIIIAATGLMTAMVGQYPIMKTGWIVWPMTLFVVSGIVFMFFVAPVQKKMHALVSASENYDRTIFSSLYRSWNIWGSLALLLPIAAAVMMVLKVPQ